MTDRSTNILLVDDHAVVRMGFRLLLEGTSNLKVVAEAESGEEAVRVYPKLQPDVVVMDISMPGIGGLEAIDRMLAREPKARILVLSAHEDVMHAWRALKAGALGYLTKRSAAEELIRAICRVAQAKIYLEPSVAQELAARRLSAEKNPLEMLSEKEFRVFLGVAKGASVAEIAEAMSLSPGTVGTHLYNIKQKLGTSNSARLAIMAMQAGLIQP